MKTQLSRLENALIDVDSKLHPVSCYYLIVHVFAYAAIVKVSYGSDQNKGKDYTSNSFRFSIQ